MTNKDQDVFEDIETIVSAPLNFKAKLAIGEDAYTALRVKNRKNRVREQLSLILGTIALWHLFFLAPIF